MLFSVRVLLAIEWHTITNEICRVYFCKVWNQEDILTQYSDSSRLKHEALIFVPRFHYDTIRWVQFMVNAVPLAEGHCWSKIKWPMLILIKNKYKWIHDSTLENGRQPHHVSNTSSECCSLFYYHALSTASIPIFKTETMKQLYQIWLLTSWWGSSSISQLNVIYIKPDDSEIMSMPLYLL